MGEVIPQSHIRWTVLASACLHAGVALLLLMRMSGVEQIVPIGIETIYLGEVNRAAPEVPAVIPRAPKVLAAQTEAAEVEQFEQPAESSVPSSAAQAGPVGARDGAVVSAVERYKYELRLFLESRKIYPETARRLHQTGTVMVNFKINSLGEISVVTLERAASSEVLNRAALDLVKSASRFKPMPPEANLSELQLSLPIEYIL